MTSGITSLLNAFYDSFGTCGISFIGFVMFLLGFVWVWYSIVFCQFVGGPRTLPWCARSAQGLDGANPGGFAPRRHLRPTAGRGVTVPYHRGPRRTLEYAGGTIEWTSGAHPSTPPGTVEGRRRFQLYGSSLGRVEQVICEITSDMIPERGRL